MSSDTVMDTFNEALDEHIENLRLQGLSSEEILKKTQTFDPTDTLEAMIETATNNLTQYFQNTMYERVFEERAISDEFTAHQEQIWGKGFVASEAMHIIAVESAGLYGEYLEALSNDAKDDKKFRYVAVRELHGRSCQVFLEILHLMKGGFADGAFARWRTMYELSIVAEFIYNHQENVAQAFIKAYDSDDKWHDWAKIAPCFETRKNHITFKDIETQCNLTTDNWKKQHELAHKVVHASSQGTFGRLGAYKPNNTILAGQTDYGIVGAAVNSAISLANTTAIFLNLIPYGDGIVHSRCLNQWIDVIRKYYWKAEDDNFGTDSK